MTPRAPLHDLTDEICCYLHNRPDCTVFLQTVDLAPVQRDSIPEFPEFACSCPLTDMPNLLQTIAPVSQYLNQMVVSSRDGLPWLQVCNTDQPVGESKVERTAELMMSGPAAPYQTANGQMGFYLDSFDARYSSKAIS